MIVGFESYDLKVHLRSLGQLTKSQLIALQVTDRRLEFTLTILLWPMMIEVTIIDDDLLSRSSFFYFRSKILSLIPKIQKNVEVQKMRFYFGAKWKQKVILE